MILYSYFNDRRANFSGNGEGTLYFLKLCDAKHSAKLTVDTGVIASIRKINIGPVNTALVLALLNGDGFVRDAKEVCKVEGEVSAAND